MNSVIVLNADYGFLNTVNWKKAFNMLIKEKVEVIKYADNMVSSADGQVYKIPAILRLLKLIRTVYRNKVPFSKKNVMVRDGFTCQYCGVKNTRLTIDHVYPKSKGGKSSFENCTTSCKECNNKKGDRLCREVKMYPKKIPNAPTISEFLMLKMKTLGIKEILNDFFNDVK